MSTPSLLDLGGWRWADVYDGKVVYESKVLNEMKDNEVEITVSLPPGVKEIQLKVDDLADTPTMGRIGLLSSVTSNDWTG